jgi:hypothetical protein
MTNLEFINLVRELRQAQKKYFKERTQSSFMVAKKLEADVDKALEDWAAFNGKRDTQIGLFDTGTKEA